MQVRAYLGFLAKNVAVAVLIRSFAPRARRDHMRSAILFRQTRLRLWPKTGAAF